MTSSLSLLTKRRFLPLFITQAMGAFNDNLFKFSMVIVVTYGMYNDPEIEFQFNALASAIFILPFFLLSALAGQLADNYDKAYITRRVKDLEIVLALIGAAGLLLQSIPLMLGALLLFGVHSSFFGPIKYAVLPQHLEKDEVLGGTGLIEAGTYVSVLLGTLLGGLIIDRTGDGEDVAAVVVILVACIGRAAAQFMPAAPPQKTVEKLDFNIFRASYRLIAATMHIRQLFLAIIAISFFWTIGGVLVIMFTPLIKNVLTSAPEVISLFLGIFSVGIAVGSVAINRLLRSEVSARYTPVSALAMGVCILLLYLASLSWQPLPEGQLYDLWSFLQQPTAWTLLLILAGVAIFGGMFVVPLYAFLTTTVDLSMTARTIAANNVVNSGCMTMGALLSYGVSLLGVSTVDQLLMVASMTIIAAWLGYQLHRAAPIVAVKL